MNLFVAGLPYDLDDAELEEIFEKFGVVKSAKIAMDKETGKSRGFGFVEMPNDSEAKEAITSLNDISLGKKPLVVKQAENRHGDSLYLTFDTNEIDAKRIAEIISMFSEMYHGIGGDFLIINESTTLKNTPVLEPVSV